jgi:hypothetical protein
MCVPTEQNERGSNQQPEQRMSVSPSALGLLLILRASSAMKSGKLDFDPGTPNDSELIAFPHFQTASDSL